jgi:hypothetical protein
MPGEPHVDSRQGTGPSSQPDLDLVEYVVMTTSGLSSIADVARALKELVESSQIAILDLVGVEVDTTGGYVAVEPEELSGLAELTTVEGRVGGLLSEDDIALTCGAMTPGTSALIMVAEDRWARRLAEALRSSGGRIVGGERIPRHRVEQSLRAWSRQRHQEGD